METLWKRFDRLSGDPDVRDNLGKLMLCDRDAGFAMLVEITRRGRRRNPDFALTFSGLKAAGGCCRDVDLWLETYLDELDLQGRYDRLQRVCETLLDLFDWAESDMADLYMRLVNALTIQEKYGEAVTFCEMWYENEADGPQREMAAAFLIYARMAAQDLTGARKVADRYISGDADDAAEDGMVLRAVSVLHEIEESRELIWEKEQLFSDYCFEEERFLAGMFCDK